MKQLQKYIAEYLSSKVSKPIEKIKANNSNIDEIVLEEVYRLGLDADLNHIDVSEVTIFKGLFSPLNYYRYVGARRQLKKTFSKFNGDVSQWDVSNAKDMQEMFRGCKKFNCDLSKWDVSNVEDMRGMFDGCANFEGIGLDTWNKKSLLKNGADGMFDGCTKMQREKNAEDATTWEVGDILAGSSGYNMVLPRFYKITKKTASQFTCIRLAGKIVDGSRNGQWHEIATDEPYEYDHGKEYKCRINKWGRVRVDDVLVSLWNGKPLYGDDMD